MMVRTALGALLALMSGVFTPFATAQLFPEVRSIPSESMLPTLLVDDRVAVRHVYKDGKPPVRGDVVVFKHPNIDRVMISRVIGLAGDTVQLKRGRLILNGKEVPRTFVRKITYAAQHHGLQVAEEYSEQLPGEAKPHRIFEFGPTNDLDDTPLFKVPPGHVFLMGDNRDNAEDSRAPSGHRALATKNPDAWPYRGFNPSQPSEYDAIGFVPVSLLIGRAVSIPYTRHVCPATKEQQAKGVTCLESNVGKPL